VHNTDTLIGYTQCATAKLQRTLTSIRSTMTEDRLEVLLLLQCHREHCPTPDNVISAFAKKARRLSDFVL